MVSSSHGSCNIERCQSEVVRGHVNITRPTWCVQYEQKVCQTDEVNMVTYNNSAHATHTTSLQQHAYILKRPYLFVTWNYPQDPMVTFTSRMFPELVTLRRDFFILKSLWSHPHYWNLWLKVKVSSYKAQYSVLRTAGNALHFTSLAYLFKLSATLKLIREGCFVQISFTVYSQILIHIPEWTGAT